MRSDGLREGGRWWGSRGVAAGVRKDADIAVIGAGAAGLFAAIWAARAAPGARVIAVDGARTLGAKILVAGGGRCNVTHDVVSERAYAGSSRNAIKKVLRRFDVPRTIEFFRDQGVTLKREETGKLFPTTDDGRTILDAMLSAARAAGVRIVNPWRVAAVERLAEGFRLKRAGEEGSQPRSDGEEELRARRIVLATGGKALPRSGSDGAGYAFAQHLGHSLVLPVLPALVPLTLAKGCFVMELSGVAVPATLEVRSATNKRLVAFTNAVLFTHFGLSGPGAMDVSRYLLMEAAAAGGLGAIKGPRLVLNVLPGYTLEMVDTALTDWSRRPGGASVARFVEALGAAMPAGEDELRENGLLEDGAGFQPRLPERLVMALCAQAGVDAAMPAHALGREQRRKIAAVFTELVLPVTGDRGFTHAEVTAGGVPLSELQLETMESRVCPGLHVCGEVCDVDGRIGGYNFQWAWASGHVAGVGAGEAVGVECAE